MHADFEVHLSKNNLFVTTSVHFLFKNLELVKNKFFTVVEKKIITYFAGKSFSVSNRALSDTLKVFCFLQNYLYFFSTSMKSVFCINSSFYFDNTLMLSKIYF